jgi:hypothetical protein
MSKFNKAVFAQIVVFRTKVSSRIYLNFELFSRRFLNRGCTKTRNTFGLKATKFTKKP